MFFVDIFVGLHFFSIINKISIITKINYYFFYFF